MSISYLHQASDVWVNSDDHYMPETNHAYFVILDSFVARMYMFVYNNYVITQLQGIY